MRYEVYHFQMLVDSYSIVDGRAVGRDTKLTVKGNVSITPRNSSTGHCAT